MEDKELEKINNKLKLIPNNFPVTLEDLNEIYKEDDL
jgi:hypothetical protein